jgi:hypothetical protein
MWFEGKWMQLEDIMLSKPSSETQRLHVLAHMWDADLIQMQQYSEKQVTLRRGHI